MAGRCAQAISLLVSYMNRTPEVAQFIGSWESVVQFDLEGEEPFAVVFKQGGAAFERGRSPVPDVTLYADSSSFFGMMIGKTSQDDAFTTGLIEVKGSIMDSVRFRHAAELTQERHKTLFSTLRALSRFT